MLMTQRKKSQWDLQLELLALKGFVFQKQEDTRSSQVATNEVVGMLRRWGAWGGHSKKAGLGQ